MESTPGYCDGSSAEERGLYCSLGRVHERSAGAGIRSGSSCHVAVKGLDCSYAVGNCCDCSRCHAGEMRRDCSSAGVKRLG